MTVRTTGLNECVRNAQGLLRALSGLADDEWLDVMIQSMREPCFAGFELPRVPPDDLQRRYNGQAGEANLRLAFTFYSVVKKYVADCGSPLRPDSRVLDFGCGWGRVTRMFLKDVLGDNLYGIDVDLPAIEICRQTMGYGTYEMNQTIPPTTFQSGSFDVICAYSVFSHLSEPVHIRWIEEFSRILTDGGVLVVTTLGRGFLGLCQSFREKERLEQGWQKSAAESFVDSVAALADYDSGRFLFSPKPSDVYGMALIPQAYVEKEWTQFLEFHDFIDDPALLPQALIVMQKTRDGTLVRAMRQQATIA